MQASEALESWRLYGPFSLDMHDRRQGSPEYSLSSALGCRTATGLKSLAITNREQLAGRTRDVLEQNTVYGNSCHSRFDYVLSARLLSCKQMRLQNILTERHQIKAIRVKYDTQEHQ